MHYTLHVAYSLVKVVKVEFQFDVDCIHVALHQELKCVYACSFLVCALCSLCLWRIWVMCGKPARITPHHNLQSAVCCLPWSTSPTSWGSTVVQARAAQQQQQPLARVAIWQHRAQPQQQAWLARSQQAAAAASARAARAAPAAAVHHR